MRMWKDDSRTETAPLGIRPSRQELCCPVSVCSYKESGSDPGRIVALCVPELVLARPGPIKADAATCTRTEKRRVALCLAVEQALLLDTVAAKCSSGCDCAFCILQILFEGKDSILYFIARLSILGPLLCFSLLEMSSSLNIFLCHFYYFQSVRSIWQLYLLSRINKKCLKHVFRPS